MDRNFLEDLLEARFDGLAGAGHLDASDERLTKASIETYVRGDSPLAHVVVDPQFRAGNRAERSRPRVEDVRAALAHLPILVYVEPDERRQEELAGTYKAFQTSPENVLAGRETFKATALNSVAATSTASSNYVAIPEYLVATPVEALLADAGHLVTYLLLDRDGSNPREARIRLSRAGPERLRAWPQH